MRRLDEIGESNENLKAKVVSHTTNKTEHTGEGQKRYEVEDVSGSEPEEDAFRRGSTCYNCVMMGFFPRNCRSKGIGGNGGKGYAQGKGKSRKARERKVQAKLADPREDFLENRKVGAARGSMESRLRG